MLSLLLLVYTSKPNIPCVSQHFHQHGLSLDHPKLPSDQNRLQSEEYLNPHYPLSGGFSRAGTVPGGTIGRPTNGSAGRLPTPVRRHSEERQEKAGGLPSSINHTAQDPSIPVGSDAPAWKRLINPTLFPHEVISLIEEIFTGGKDKVDMICDLLGDDAQTFINVIHEVCLILSSRRHDLITFSSVSLFDFQFVLPRLGIFAVFHHTSRRSV